MIWSVLVVIAAARYRSRRAPRLQALPPLSVLCPLSGAADSTEANLGSLFAQDYPEFEVLLSVRDLSDPAVPIARKVMSEYPHVPSRLMVAESPFSEPRHDIAVMSDSDTRLAPRSFRRIVSELAQPGVGLVICPYRATAGPGLWSRLEALGLNTEFIAGLLIARLVNGMDVANGSTIATRKSGLAGKKVVLSRCIVELDTGSGNLAESWRQRVRRARSARRSRPLRYLGEIFTRTTVIALALWMVTPAAWGLSLIGLVFRWSADWATGIWVLNDPLVEKYWWLLPFEGIASFFTWLLGFFWRGAAKDGRFESA
jgi:ceramide glucosyltransferase